MSSHFTSFPPQKVGLTDSLGAYFQSFLAHYLSAPLNDTGEDLTSSLSSIRPFSRPLGFLSTRWSLCGKIALFTSLCFFTRLTQYPP